MYGHQVVFVRAFVCFFWGEEYVNGVTYSLLEDTFL